jgi:cyclopropane fatty-acyl-phospholipid synthase-like methyltransferase
MYSSGGALEYIQNNQTNPETEKWERLLSYIETQLHSDKQKTILEFGSGCGELAVMLQAAGYNIIATDAVDTFLEEQNRVGINQVIKYNFLSDDFDTVFDFKADLIVSWRNPHLDIDDMKKLFEVAYNGLNDNGLLIINFQNADVHPNANVLSNGTKYEYKILEDKKTKEKRFYAYFSKEDIESLRKDYFDVEEYHTEGGKEQKNWHVLTLRKTTKK